MNNWKGKKWYCYGTSLTAPTISRGRIGWKLTGEGYQGRMGYYAEHLAKLSGMEEHNFGLGGVGIIPSLHPDDNNKKRVMTLDDGKAEADLITVEVIPNDFGLAPLGEVTDTCDETFCGNLNQIIEYLLKNTKARVIILIATRQRFSHLDCNLKYLPTTETVLERIKWEEATEKICKMHGVPCFNGASEAGLGYWRVFDDDGVYYNDNIHLASEGGRILAEYYFGKLQSIYPFKK